MLHHPRTFIGLSPHKGELIRGADVNIVMLDPNRTEVVDSFRAARTRGLYPL